MTLNDSSCYAYMRTSADVGDCSLPFHVVFTGMATSSKIVLGRNGVVGSKYRPLYLVVWLNHFSCFYGLSISHN